MRFKVTTPPAEEPVSLAEAKDHLRVLHDDDDAYIEGLIVGAREYVEEHTSRALITQTITLWLDGIPRRCRDSIQLPRPPLIAVTAISYVDGNGTTQTLASGGYQVVTSGDPGLIIPSYGSAWPQVRSQMDAMRVEYTAGYGDADAVPRRAKEAMLLLMGHRYQNREAVNVGNITTELPMAVESLLGLLAWGGYR